MNTIPRPRNLTLMQRRMAIAEMQGAMTHRGYKLSRWGDGLWHIYPPHSHTSIGEEVSLSIAIQVVEADITKGQEHDAN